MIFAQLPLTECAGAVLAHSLLLSGKRYPKGQTVDDAVLAAAGAAGLDRLWVARMEAGDIGEAEAARLVGEALAGFDIQAKGPVHGRANLHAGADGLLMVKTAAIEAVNQRYPDVAIATLPPFTPVRAGELAATVKIIPYAMNGEQLGQACAQMDGALSIRRWRQDLSALLVQTGVPASKLLAKTAEVTKARLAVLSIGCRLHDPLPHAVEPLAHRLRSAAEPLLLVAGETATADHRDVIPAAIRAAGGEVLRVGMPVDPGNLLVLGRIGERIVIGLPGCARSPKRNGLDLLLERIAAGLPVTDRTIAAMGVGGLLEEAGRPVPWAWAS